MARQLPIVHVNGKDYFVDKRLQELRNTRDFMDAIRFRDAQELDTFVEHL
ncbi:MAG: hypothetical protein U5L00_07375 [Desulfovermiculus sp.]|nr:hypothetical protein [Desulfovermiculus sp.]